MTAAAIFLMGPTAAGKTAMAISLADRFPVEIVSVDSAMVYRGMDIGTAKPAADLLERYPHRLVNILDPWERYSAARFRDDALRDMADIQARGNVPLLVGGTMLYFRALEHGLADMPAADPGLREKIEKRAANQGMATLHAELAGIDPAAARRIDRNDAQRIQRALEVYYLTGKTITEHHAAGVNEAFPYRTCKMILAPAERGELHRRIEARFEEMLANGLLDEVKSLLEHPNMSADLPSMRAVGYRQACEYLAGRYGREELRRRGIVATRRYAKRQLTWMRGEAGASWINVMEPDPGTGVFSKVEEFLTENK